MLSIGHELYRCHDSKGVDELLASANDINYTRFTCTFIFFSWQLILSDGTGGPV
jgi:hypothetical protein